MIHFNGKSVEEIVVLGPDRRVLAVIRPDLDDVVTYEGIEVLFAKEYGHLCEETDGRISYHPAKEPNS